MIEGDVDVESTWSAEGFIQFVRVICRSEKDRIFLDMSDHVEVDQEMLT